MNDNSIQKTRTHNTVVGIMTLAGIGTIVGSVSLNWEFWVPPLIVIGLVAMWGIHITQYGSWTFRENFYLIFSMLLSFYHGVHYTSIFEIVVVSALLMVNVTLFARREFITLMLVECIFLLILQVIMNVRAGTIVFDTLTVSKLSLHVLGEFCIYFGLSNAIKNNRRDSEELRLRNSEKETTQEEMEDFLVNISHELRTPVNVINGMSTLILKKEDRDDVVSIQDAGLRLSRQIEDIQDYSEIQRGDVILEEDKYMITSLLNDIVSNYRVYEKGSELEFIVDLDPHVPAVMYGDSVKIAKVITHLLDNAAKFTRRGGIYLKVSSIKREYGVNLIIEVTDTGIGISEQDAEKISKGLYQSNRKRDRSTGGIGLGFSIVYGFVRKMNGFVSIDSKKGKGTTVRVSIAQSVIDSSPCLTVDSDRSLNVAMYVSDENFKLAQVKEFYRAFSASLASGLKINLYSASNPRDLKMICDRGDITHVFMGMYEYNSSPGFFDELAGKDVLCVVLADEGFSVRPGSRVITMNRPLFVCPVVTVLGGESSTQKLLAVDLIKRPVLDGLRGLVVDDEPMNLVVASGLFKDYNMIIDTALSGREALEKFSQNDYDIVFMDHMMPEMDGVEAMKRIKELAVRQNRITRVVALTANAISGAREMFLREGFDGFISKPININEFERVMNQVTTGIMINKREEADD